jgi:ABC-2 type transport system ATP-binding protein
MDTLVDLRKQGKTILFSTHRMDQVEKICDAIALISRGHLVLSGGMREVKSRYPRNRVQVSFEGDDAFLAHPSIETVKNYGGQAEIKLHSLNGSSPNAQPLLVAAMQNGTRITRFEVMEPTLEEIFIETVGDNVDA